MSNPVSLRDAIQQTRAFESPEAEALLTLVWTQDRVAEVANFPLIEEDLSPAQYNVLRILRGSPDGLQTHDVARRMIARAPNLTRLVDKLKAKGYLERRGCSSDRRVIYLQITRAGLDVMERLDQPMFESVNRAMTGLETGELAQLIRLLNKISGGPETASGKNDNKKKKRRPQPS